MQQTACGRRESQKRSDEGSRGLWPGSAPQVGVFSGFQYLTPPLHADMTIKEQALARVQQPGTTPGRYRAPDSLLAFLDNL